VLLRQVELALLLKTRAIIMLVQGPELGPVLGDLLGETVLRLNGAGPSGLLVLGAGRHLVGNMTQSSSYDSCKCMSTQVWSCWLHVL